MNKKETLRLLRLAGITKQQVAERAGVSRVAVMAVFKGRFNSPKIWEAANELLEAHKRENIKDLRLDALALASFIKQPLD